MAAELAGRRFYKMTGSGNDFVFFDSRDGIVGIEAPSVIERICARGTGVGADGVVVLEFGEGAVAIRYYNADGSRAELCGNATLCTVSLAARLGLAGPGDFAVLTDAGLLQSRVRDGRPEFDLPAITDALRDYGPVELAGSEERVGFATVGVPHLVVRVPDAGQVDVVGRGAPLRRHPSLAGGANVNFVSRAPNGWRMRTFERGVEAETLACGTGSVATAVMLREWGDASGDVVLETSSGAEVTVRLEQASEGSGGGSHGSVAWRGSLSGEGRLVYEGRLGEL